MVEFEVNELPKMPNGLLRKHFRVITKEKKRWHDWVAFKCVYQRPRKAYEKSHLILTRHSTQEPDYDGLVGSFKYVIDGLKQCGVIIDDKPSNIVASYNWSKSKLKDQRITVKVMPVD